MLQEIVRQPELFKALCGSSLCQTSMDPILDKMSEKQKKKLDQLNKFQAKGLDVEKLKTSLLNKHASEWDKDTL